MNLTEQDPAEKSLPPLREDLQLMRGAPSITGKPTFLIYDAVQHRYFKISLSSFRLLSLWHNCQRRIDLLTAVAQTYGLTVSLDELMELEFFVIEQSLVAETEDGWRHYARRAKNKKQSPFNRLMHSYLFFRIPLLRPDKALGQLYPYISFVFSKGFGTFILCVSLIGLYLVARQWEAFFATFLYFISFEGIVFYGLALIAIKILHELGHAFTAKHFGCRVPVMGVAFMFLFPLLYTDVTDAWKLRSRRQRVLIGAAGMITEFGVAGLASFLWVFMPEGVLKSTAFFAATVSWTLSLAVNVNPFMRFDGYYLLADSTGVENLQPRAFALGRWKLREWFFDLGSSPPEIFSRGTTGWMIAYAWCTWIYRMVLFLSIALLVYFLFFKVLGVILFVLEIIWLLAKPVWSELKEWWKMKERIAMRVRSYVTLGIFAVLAGLCFVPLSETVSVPALLEPAQFERVFAKHSTRIQALNVKPHQFVKKDQVLVELRSNMLEQELQLNASRLKLVEARLDRIAADPDERLQAGVLMQQRQALQERRGALIEQLGDLIIRAPIDGYIRDIDAQVHPGRWIDRRQRLFNIVGGETLLLRGYVKEADVFRLQEGAEGTFLPDDIQSEKFPVTLAGLSRNASEIVDLPVLTSDNGGWVAVRRNQDDQLVPVEAQYLVRFSTGKMASGIDLQVQRGVAQIEAEPRSLATFIWAQVLKVLVREAGV